MLVDFEVDKDGINPDFIPVAGLYLAAWQVPPIASCTLHADESSGSIRLMGQLKSPPACQTGSVSKPA
jgi:hypothetical protein